MLLEELAEDLVSATSGLLDGRIINIMNPDGIIIASTQPERIGTFHKGARDAAVSGKPVSIRPDQIQEYSGAREGYNMPLRVGGNIIGVVGIYGEPSEIRYLAHLVEVYTEKYYQLEALIRPQYAQGALKSILSELVRQDRLIVVEKFSVEAPKTKLLAQKLKDMALEDVLIITGELDENLFLAARNLHKVDVRDANGIDPVSLIAFDKVVMTADAVKQVEEMLA